jgi:hypothetical protein
MPSRGTLLYRCLMSVIEGRLPASHVSSALSFLPLLDTLHCVQRCCLLRVVVESCMSGLPGVEAQLYSCLAVMLHTCSPLAPLPFKILVSMTK